MAEMLGGANVKRRGRRTFIKKETILQRASTLLGGGKNSKKKMNKPNKKATKQKKFAAASVKTLSTSERLVAWTLQRKHVANALSGATQLLLLAHTPVSRKVFQYFHFNDIAGRGYMHADYRILEDSDAWTAFLPLVALVLLVFTLGLPSMIGHYLWVHWGDELYSTSVVQRVGFLYSAYNRGAEFWQIHDVIMKMILTGLLIFIPSIARPCVGIHLMMGAITNLNYFKPHKIAEIFWLTQLSFAVTLTKYAIATLLQNMELQGASEESVLRLGLFLISWPVVGLKEPTSVHLERKGGCPHIFHLKPDAAAIDGS